MTTTPDFDVEKFVVPAAEVGITGALAPREVFWRKNYQFLKEHGYTLRARYRTDWIPSWWGTSKDWEKCEDGVIDPRPLMDATRADGTVVMLKAIDPARRPAEIPLRKLLSSKRLASPRNRCMHYLDVLEQGPNQAFIVMPVLLRVEDAPFETIGEGVEFVRQIFEVALL
ncbi:hypothetical protein H0H92_000599 [Tricholoma furcatifolium]|nr:hypothetical protein H0H92_000599 [Tricholoma furcatifolium]